MTELGAPIPVLRIFDETKAREYYVDFIGFEIEFEHRYADDYPLYLGVTLSGCKLHLTEHHGDCSPVAKVRIPTANVATFCKSLLQKDTKFAKPGGGQMTPWGMKECTLTDPFGNKLVFYEDASVGFVG